MGYLKLKCLQHASWTEWSSGCLQTKWLCVRFPLHLLKVQLLHLFRTKSSLILGNYKVQVYSKRACDMIKTQSMHDVDNYS